MVAQQGRTPVPKPTACEGASKLSELRKRQVTRPPSPRPLPRRGWSPAAAPYCAPSGEMPTACGLTARYWTLKWISGDLDDLTSVRSPTTNSPSLSTTAKGTHERGGARTRHPITSENELLRARTPARRPSPGNCTKKACGRPRPPQSDGSCTPEGLVVPEPKKRPESSYIRFEAYLFNGCSQADITHCFLADGTRVEVLDLLDDRR